MSSRAYAAALKAQAHLDDDQLRAAIEQARAVRHGGSQHVHLEQAYCARLAKARGWNIAGPRGGLWQVAMGSYVHYERDVASAGVIDHAVWFSINRRPVAVLSHSYENRPKAFEQLAEQLSLCVEILPWSCYSAQTVAVLFWNPDVRRKRVVTRQDDKTGLVHYERKDGRAPACDFTLDHVTRIGLNQRVTCLSCLGLDVST